MSSDSHFLTLLACWHMNRVKDMGEECRDSRFKKQVIIDYIAGKINRRSASIKLHTSETYVSTLKRQYLRDGDKAYLQEQRLRNY